LLGITHNQWVIAFSVPNRRSRASYPHICCQPFFADAELYGPYDIQVIAGVPKPEGGGGTSFVPFFDWLNKHQPTNTPPHGERLTIYLTDGYGDFPEQPDYPVLWVVTDDGRDADEFPFGKVTRLNHTTRSGVELIKDVPDS
jgi:predicted metal-dependent peptidase